jgi:hypothetical protein
MHVTVVKDRLRDLRHRSVPIEEYITFRDQHYREYDVDGGGCLLVMPGLTIVDDPSPLSAGEIYVSPRGVVTSRGLMQLAAAARYAERWLAGEVDDLPPSGPWMDEAIADIVAAAQAVVEAPKGGRFSDVSTAITTLQAKLVAAGFNQGSKPPTTD